MESSTLKSNHPLSYEACPRLHKFFCTHFQICLPPSCLEIWVLAPFSSRKNAVVRQKMPFENSCCCIDSKMAVNKYQPELHNISEEWRARIQDLSVLWEEFPLLFLCKRCECNLETACSVQIHLNYILMPCTKYNICTGSKQVYFWLPSNWQWSLIMRNRFYGLLQK